MQQEDKTPMGPPNDRQTGEEQRKENEAGNAGENTLQEEEDAGDADGSAPQEKSVASRIAEGWKNLLGQ